MNCIIINISVSVPCRGTTFLNPLKICKDYNTSFRPLSGNYISQSFNGVYYERGIHCFRPLSGNYISQCITITVKEILDNVSVPCRGTTFLNRMQISQKSAPREFPSPVGELHFSMPGNMMQQKTSFSEFPSPVVEIHFSISITRWLTCPTYVSVPCRGTTFLNKITP